MKEKKKKDMKNKKKSGGSSISAPWTFFLANYIPITQNLK